MARVYVYTCAYTQIRDRGGRSATALNRVNVCYPMESYRIATRYTMGHKDFRSLESFELNASEFHLCLKNLGVLRNRKLSA